MCVRQVLTVATVLAAGVILVGTGATTQGQETAFVPYGSQRGHIHIGPRHTRIRWGNGFTEYGAQVFTHAIDALPGILPIFMKEADAGAAKSASEPIEFPAHYTAELQRANNLLERSARLLGHDISTPAADSGGTPGNGHDSFRNSPDPWGPNGAAPPNPAAPGPAPPPPANNVSDAIRNSADPWKD